VCVIFFLFIFYRFIFLNQVLRQGHPKIFKITANGALVIALDCAIMDAAKDRWM
jgi:hypothetical protein